MSNKYFFCKSFQDDRRTAKVISSPLSASHALRSCKSGSLKASSWNSTDTLVEKGLPPLPPSPLPQMPIVKLPQAITPPILRPSLSTHVSQAQLKFLGDQAAVAYTAFLQVYPEYHNTWIIDALRRTDFARLDRAGETYVDYMGGAQHPECLVRVHSDFLTQSIMGNTHSVSNSSRLSSKCADEARSMVLSFFEAPPDYTVIFTPNATGALKLVGESFPFREDSSFVLGVDSHNSVHGIRQFAARRGARICYIPSTPNGGFEPSVARDILRDNRPSSSSTPSLFALTAQSNISNSKNPLSILQHASSFGFYKMFGYPTGIGAFVVKKSFLEMLERPWFAGGTVNVVQVPGTLVTRAPKLHEQFEDGTINYLTLSAVTDGLRFLSAYLPFLPLRLSCLMHYLTSAMAKLRHDVNGMPVVKILSKLPSRRLKSIGEQSDAGSTVSFIVLSPSGDIVPNSFIEHVATMHNISLRTGCMCNPGGASAMLGIQNVMDSLCDAMTLRDIEAHVGRELGVVRVSLGIGSDWGDVWRVIRFLDGFGDERRWMAWWNAWKQAPTGQRA